MSFFFADIVGRFYDDVVDQLSNSLIIKTRLNLLTI